jgi:hypothetical protein
MLRLSPRWAVTSLGLLSLACEDAKGRPDDIVAACQHEIECAGQGALTQRECQDALNASYDEATTYGCGSAYADWVSCLATLRGPCPPPFIIDSAPSGSSGDEPKPYADPCQPAHEAFRDCQGTMRRDECFVLGYGGAGGCMIGCALFSGECAAPSANGPSSSCSCEAGAKVGASFTGACGSQELETLARDACQ